MNEHRPKILIVDDRLENLVALEKLLGGFNVEFIRALSGNEAITLTFTHTFALAIVDIQMPEMDGYETVELLRQEEQTKLLPVIFVSAIYKDDYYIVKGIEGELFSVKHLVTGEAFMVSVEDLIGRLK